MKKLLILVFALLLCLMATSALAAETTYSGVCDPIVINQPGEHTIILDGVTIVGAQEVVDELGSTDWLYSPAISVKSPATKLTIILRNGTTNTVTGGYGCASIANNGLDLVIRCESAGEGHECTKACGKLNASGTDQAAGIGGNAWEAFSGTVTIMGGIITANGGTYAESYGIGGNSFDGNVIITGGIITAKGREGGGGIGGNRGGFNGTVTISGGSVTATGDSQGVGIGSYWGTFSGTVTISGGEVNAKGDYAGDGIGGGVFSGTVSITGGKVTAMGGELGSGIGGGSISDKGRIIISGGTVIAASLHNNGAGIGSGVYYEMKGTITITDSTVTGSIGSGQYGEMSGTITITDSTVIAKGENGGAGIGSGDNGEMSGTITITDSTVTANGHAGIGAGYGGNFTGKLIMKGDVDVTAIGDYQGIGPGDNGSFGEGAEIYVEPTNNVIGVKQGANESSAVNLAGTPYSVKTDLIPLLNGSSYVRTRYNIPEYAATAQTEGGGSVSANPAKGEEGTEVTLTATPGEGYRFVRWEVISGGVTITDNKFTIGTSDVVVNGIFEKLTYPITWKNYNGDVLKVDPVVPYGDTPAYNGATPVKPADAQYTYTFTGWSPAITPVTGEAEYTAQFTNGTNTYPITWKNYNGDVLKVDPAVSYGDTPSYNGETPTKPADAQYTYTFTGWSPAVTPVTGEAEYTAQFTNGTNTYPITWKNYNGDVLKVDPAVPYGDTPAYNGETPVKPADAQYTYTFTGWSPAISPVTKEADYIAQFTATLNTYVITWKNYDGTVLEKDEAVGYGIIPIYNGATPTRPADDKYTYTFKGWSPAVTAASADCEYVAVYEATVPQIPQTGDSMNFVLTAALAAVGMIGMTVIIRKKKEA